MSVEIEDLYINAPHASEEWAFQKARLGKTFKPLQPGSPRILSAQRLTAVARGFAAPARDEFLKAISAAERFRGVRTPVGPGTSDLADLPSRELTRRGRPWKPYEQSRASEGGIRALPRGAPSGGAYANNPPSWSDYAPARNAVRTELTRAYGYTDYWQGDGDGRRALDPDRILKEGPVPMPTTVGDTLILQTKRGVEKIIDKGLGDLGITIPRVQLPTATPAAQQQSAQVRAQASKVATTVAQYAKQAVAKAGVNAIRKYGYLKIKADLAQKKRAKIVSKTLRGMGLGDAPPPVPFDSDAAMTGYIKSAFAAEGISDVPDSVILAGLQAAKKAAQDAVTDFWRKASGMTGLGAALSNLLGATITVAQTAINAAAIFSMDQAVLAEIARLKADSDNADTGGDKTPIGAKPATWISAETGCAYFGSMRNKSDESFGSGDQRASYRAQGGCVEGDAAAAGSGSGSGGAAGGASGGGGAGTGGSGAGAEQAYYQGEAGGSTPQYPDSGDNYMPQEEQGVTNPISLQPPGGPRTVLGGGNKDILLLGAAVLGIAGLAYYRKRKGKR